VIILAVAGLPLAGALLLTGLYHRPYLGAALASATLTGSAALAIHQAEAAPFMFLGRSIALTPPVAVAIASCALLAAAVTLHSATVEAPVTSHIIVLAATGALAGAVMIRNLTIASILLIMGAVLATMLIPSKRDEAPMQGARSLLTVVLLLPLLLVAVRPIETTGTIQRLPYGSPSLGLLALSLAVAIGVAAFPFHVWLSPVYRNASGQAITMMGVVLMITVLGHLHNVLQAAAGGEIGEHLATLLTVAGLASAVFGGLAALPQRSLGAILAYTAVADVGIVLIGLGSGNEAGVSAARLHLLYRGIAVAGVAMSLDTFRHQLGGDDDYHLRGAMQRAPLTVAGGAIAMLSLSGLPLTAGFATRLVVYPVLASQQPVLALAVLMASVGPIWASARLIRTALAPSLVPVERKGPLLSGFIVLLMGIALVALGLWPAVGACGAGRWLLPLTTTAMG